MSDWIDVKGIDEAELLAALYNGSKAQGMGEYQEMFRYEKTGGNLEMSVEEAREILEEYPDRALVDGKKSFDYLYGRVMKVRIGGDLLDPRLYDRDNGYGAAARVVEGLLERLTSPEE